MSLHSKICAVILALLAGAQLFAGNYTDIRGGERLPSDLGYLSAIAEEDNRKIVVLLTGLEWNGPCKVLEREILRTWDWSTFAHSEIVFETFDFPAEEIPLEGDRAKKDIGALLREKFGDHGFPTFIVTESDGTILSHVTGHLSPDPKHYMDWIRSL